MGTTGATVLSRPAERAAWFVLPLAIAVVSRFYSVFLLLLFQHQAGHQLPMLIDDGSPLVAWDGQWYLHIAQHGYHAQPIQPGGPSGHHDFAFFPGWPLLIRLVSLGGLLPMAGMAVALSNVLFVMAALTFYRVFAERFDERVALGGVLLLAFNPAAYVFSMGYSEALFVLLLGLFFLFETRLPAPIAAGFAMLTRVSGLAIGASQAVMLVIRRDARPIRILSVIAVVAVFAGWWIFIWQLTGNPKGWLEGSASWTRSLGPASVARALHREWLPAVLWGSFVVLMFVGSALLVRRQPQLALFGMFAIMMSVIGAPMSSMPRHSMIAVPAFAALALRLGSRMTAVVAIAFAIAQILFVNFAFGSLHGPP
jgi:mannosyltransferase PIG-V